MGLFDFVKGAGEKIWDAISGGDKKSRADKLKEHINKLQIPDADKVDIQVGDDGTVTLSGNIPSQEAKEKIMVAVGNVEGVGKVNDKITVAQGGEESRYYTVKSGDTLSAISKEIYGTPNEYQRIFEANKPMLKSPEKIYPGQVLIIPKK